MITNRSLALLDVPGLVLRTECSWPSMQRSGDGGEMIERGSIDREATKQSVVKFEWTTIPLRRDAADLKY